MWISRVFRALLGVLALALAIGLFVYLSESREAPAQTDEAHALPIVRAVRVEPQPVASRWSGYGTARALDASDVAAEVAGRVTETPDGLEAGVSVSEGDLLARLDPRDYQSRADAARLQAESFEAQLSALEIEEARLSEQAELLAGEVEIAQRDLDRARQALQQGAGNESAIDARLQNVNSLNRSRAAVLSQLEVIPSRRAQLRASLNAARADQRLAEDNLGRVEIRAPFSGVVQEVGLEVGEWARIGDTVARVVDLSVIEVPLRVPQSAAGRISVGDEAVIREEGAGGQRWVGSVGRIAPEADPSIRSATVFVEVRQRPDGDAGRLLRPGQFVMGEIVSNDIQDRMILPRRAIDAGRVLVAAPLRESDPSPPAGARTPMVVREAEVSVMHRIGGSFPAVSPAETQWAVVSSVEGPRGVTPGDLVLTSNLETMRVGDLIDVRLETETVNSAEGGTP